MLCSARACLSVVSQDVPVPTGCSRDWDSRQPPGPVGTGCLGSDAPRVDEVADGELRRQRGLQPLGVQHQVIVQEARVGVERSHLLGAGLHHIWVAVAHWEGEGETPLVRHRGWDEATPTKHLQICVSECLP